MESISTTSGTLSVVGLGITLGQVTKDVEGVLRSADVVFSVVNTSFSQAYLCQLNQDVRDLRSLYGVGKQRRQTYLEMVDVVLAEVRNGRRVCFAVYGHPGMFAYPTHLAIRRARAEGYQATMLPALSAQDCLFADLGIDPSWYGCQSFEATDMLKHSRTWSRDSTLIVYQVAAVGISTQPSDGEASSAFESLFARLLDAYGKDHMGILYEAAIFPFYAHRSDQVPISEMRPDHFRPETTLVILPTDPRPDDCLSLEPADAVNG